MVPLGARITLSIRITKRQKQFAEQLDDSLQLMASNLRAGHSLPQALSSVAKEADSPTAEEFARIVNETRVGRDLGLALDVTAERMASEDFSWVTQAIAINREVGGNLAEVLDGVADTIRQRNEIRGQVATLSAEEGSLPSSSWCFPSDWRRFCSSPTPATSPRSPKVCSDTG
ncbi:type II secretion system F family protein [Nesterenkonia pannonica]|uniref:type II secretion system F family protein n=1 Tax=Nesterenkonia pannonica TaxID=1548602 RepID=UPI0021644F20|nr:type II secretion system F family protein [Nesterenkonia pannonica]